MLGLYQIITKKVSEYDSSEVSLFYSSVVGIIIMSLPALSFWKPIDSSSYILFLAIGVFFSMGVYLQITALGKARASIIQPFHYTLIFWAIILGYIFYEDIPDLFTLIGALVITISGIFVLNQTTSKK